MGSIPTCVHFGPNNICVCVWRWNGKKEKKEVGGEAKGKIHGLAVKVQKYRSLLFKRKKKKGCCSFKHFQVKL